MGDAGDRGDRGDRLSSAPGWEEFFDVVERSTSAVGAEGFSIGVAQRDEIHTFNLGFLSRTSTMFASIPVSAALPGPYAFRTGSPQFFATVDEACSRFPESAAISDGHPYRAAACLPLDGLAGGRLGYLALHWVQSHAFDDTERRRLDHAGRLVSSSLLDLLRAAPPAASGESADRPASLDDLRLELAGLRRAMESRATIEQAKGILMERFGIDATQAWRLMTRWPSERNRKVRDVARDLVEGRDPSRGRS